MEHAHLSPNQFDLLHPRRDEESRYDIYAIIHKALRLFMCDTLVKLGSMDGDAEQEAAEGLAQLRALTAFCGKHLEHENAFVHSAMEMRRPGSSAAIADDHVHHRQALSQLEMLADAVERENGAARAAAIARLYRQLALFVADNLTHMNVEETAHNAVLWATHSDAELIAIEQAIVASLPPQESLQTMRWMIPAMNATERAEKLCGLRAHAPAPVFDSVYAVAQAHLPERDWHKLNTALAPSGRAA